MLRICKLSAIILVLLSQTGCWDRREVNDVAFVIGSAFDKEKDKLRVALQVALPGQQGGAGSKGGGGGTSGDQSYFMQSDTGNSVREINNRQQLANSRQLYFAHRRVVLIGEELARSGLEPVMDVLGRVPQNRLTSYVVITEDKAEKVLETNVPVEKYPGELIRELAVNAMRNPRSVKHALNAMLTEGIDLAVPYVSLTKNKGGTTPKIVKIQGLSVFHDNKLAGFLKGDQSSMALMLMQEAKTPEFTLPAPQGTGSITVRVEEYSTDKQPSIKRGKIGFDINIKGRGLVVENESTMQLSTESQLVKLEKALNAKLKSDTVKSLHALQKKYNSDVIGLGQALHLKEPTKWPRYKDWHSHFPGVETEIHPHIIIENVGQVIKPLGRRDKELKHD
ncbi:Ger(x)C family spore germination protein [Peribacillus sp. SCS-155]|uniref:Ger(x)C family spore germination protein n=1 Tax=Peribacillus sedimenti TaxID=3115297 RepID=UPI003906BD85